MKMKRRIVTLGLAVVLSILPINTAIAEEQMDSRSTEEICTEVPTLQVVEESEKGSYSVIAKDSNGNIIFEESGIVGDLEKVVNYVYESIFESGTRACSHIPCKHIIVLGGINHIISGSTCTMVRYKFYKCGCCNAIIGMVPNSATVVGTHSAH